MFYLVLTLSYLRLFLEVGKITLGSVLEMRVKSGAIKNNENFFETKVGQWVKTRS